MCDITNQNFNEKYDEILKVISKSDFIALDCEFSGLTRENHYKQTLFDTPSENYEKFHKGSKDFVALQIGITAFTYSRDEKYEALTYTFYLFPRSYSGSDIFFLCDAHSIEFLSEQHFNFNRVFHNGITYMRLSEESSLKKEIEDGRLVSRIRRDLSRADRKVIRSLCDQVLEWNLQAESGDTILLDVTGVEPFKVYLIREEIESRFPLVRAHKPKGGTLRVEMTEGKVVGQRDTTDEVFAIASGFTRLLKEVIALKKPIVGHNLFSDLLIIYKMFIAPVPDSYETFKKEIHKLFPEVYDTKYLSTQIKKLVNTKNLWPSNALYYLYKYFHEEKDSSIVLDMPIIEFKSFCGTPRCENHHDSGFDSYCTGYIFLKLAHMFSMWDPNENKFKSFSLGNGPVRCFSAVKDKKNKLNLMRSYVDHISLDGPDPARVSPDLILMESLAGAIDITKVSDIINKYDSADVKRLTMQRALIAPSNNISSKIIRRQLRKNKNFRLITYRPDSKRTAAFKKGVIALTLIGGIGIATFLYCNLQGV